MWPWEHFAVGYIVVSLLARFLEYRVEDWAFGFVLFGSQFPDLVDKPLAWTFNVLPSGTTLAHSVFIAVPFSVAVLVWGIRQNKRWLAVAFIVPYLLHLSGDAVYGMITLDQPASIGAILWPLVPKSPGGSSAGIIGETLYYLAKYESFLTRPEAVRYLLLEGVLLGAALLLWLYDDRPGLGPLERSVRRGFARR